MARGAEPSINLKFALKCSRTDSILLSIKSEIITFFFKERSKQVLKIADIAKELEWMSDEKVVGLPL